MEGLTAQTAGGWKVLVIDETFSLKFSANLRFVFVLDKQSYGGRELELGQGRFFNF